MSKIFEKELFIGKANKSNKIIKAYDALEEESRAIGKNRTMGCSDVIKRFLILKQLAEHFTAKTDYKSIADFFERLGFMVTMDFDNIQYVIVA